MMKSLKTRLRPRIVALLSDSVIKYNAKNPGRPAGMPGSDPYTEARIQYLLNEVSDLRVLVRDLIAPKANANASQAQTKESFSYQWAEIKEGLALLGDPDFERQMVDLLCKYSDYPRDWFKGKKVLDAGCGMGRWSYVFRELGADVTAVDQSASGVAHLQSLLADKGSFRAQRADLLEPLPLAPEFDFVWCYGVTHHTGNTKRAVEHVAAVVKPGGRLFLMIYGEPTNYSGFVEINTYVEHRRATQNMTFEEKEAYLKARYPENLVHGFFDAISPEINDLHRFDEIKRWLVDLGFKDVRLTLDNRNLHLVAEKPAH